MNVSQADTESELLERAKNGDREAFWELAAPSVDQIYRLAWKMVKSQEDAEDVLQESFLKALDAIEGFQGKSRFNTWLHRIAVNQALMKLRKRRADVFSLDAPRGDDPDGETQDLADFSESALDGLEQGEANGILEEALDGLPIDLRTVVVLRDLSRLTNDETAQALEIPLGAVKWRLHRGRMMLRDELSSYFDERASAAGRKNR